MAKQPKTIYDCQECGNQERKWNGQCKECGKWNTFVEEKFRPTPQTTGKNVGKSVSTFRETKPLQYKDIKSQDDDRTSSGIEEFDRVLGGGIVAGSLILIGGNPGIGKCVSGSTRVFNPKTGDFQKIDNWKNTNSILSLNCANNKLCETHSTAFQEQGKKKVFELKTRLGKKVVCTDNHPFLTNLGWKPLSELKPKDRIATPSELAYFGNETLESNKIKLVAYMLSDGSPQGTLGITSMLVEVEKDTYEIAKHFGLTVRVYPKTGTKAKDYRLVIPHNEKVLARQTFSKNLINVRDEKQFSWAEIARKTEVEYSTIRTWRDGRGVPSKKQFNKLTNVLEVSQNDLKIKDRTIADILNPAASFIDSIGLRFSKANNKFVPDCIFRLPKKQLSLFLKILFSCDGSVYVNKRGQAGLSYSTISLRLAEDVQHLLLRFGFVSKLRTKKSKVNNKPYTAYEIQLLGIEDVKRFLKEISIYGRNTAKTNIDAISSPNFASTQKDTIPTGKEFWVKLKELFGNNSFLEISKKAGIHLRDRRHERPLCRSTVQAIANTYPNSFLDKIAFNDIYWDEVETIKYIGEEEVYDITASEHENFVANDLIIHNSTLVAQVSDKLSQTGGKVLYISGEESERQIKMRGERLGLDADNLFLLPETNLEAILSETERLKPDFVIVDSIQTVFSEKLESAPGSVSQVRGAASEFMMFAKGTATPTFLIGHVTKEGSIAGPKTLEHIVDTVLYFEGDRHHNHRIIRAVKNRFGAANEIGVFEMTNKGLIPVGNPSEVFLQERPEGASGSVVTVCMEGTRPMLVEVQALVSSTNYGTGRRMAQGFDYNRTALLIAVLEKRLGFQIGNDDIFINIAGGLEVSEPAADLGVIASIASSFKNLQIPPETAVFGEVGLTGEVRGVLQAQSRAREAQTLGFKKLILPMSNKKGLEKLLGIRIIGVRNLEEAMDELF